MMRSTLDEYLDEALDAVARAEVERALAQDPATGRLLAKMKAERALRTAAYASYMPTGEEAAALAARVFDEVAAPIGQVGNFRWIRWTAGVAAALVIAASAFGIGRVTAPTQVVTKEVEVTDLAVVSGNDLQVQHLTSREAYQNYIQKLTQERDRNNPIVVTDYTIPGKM